MYVRMYNMNCMRPIRLTLSQINMQDSDQLHFGL